MARGKGGTSLSNPADDVEELEGTGIASRVGKRRRTSFRKQNSPPKRTKYAHVAVEPPIQTPANGSQEDEQSPSLKQEQPEGTEEVADIRNGEHGAEDGLILHTEEEDGESEGGARTSNPPQLDGTTDETCETFEGGADSTVIQNPASLTMPSTPSLNRQISIIKRLDQAAEDVLDYLLQKPFDELYSFVTHAETEPAKEWRMLVSILSSVRRFYSGDEHYIKPSDIVNPSSTTNTSIYRANLATAVTTLLDPKRENLAQLHSHFLEAFIRPEGRMVEWQSVVLHELKAHVCMAKIQENTLPMYSALNDIFPGNIEQLFRQQGLGFNGPHLSPSEIIFLNKCSQTRQRLLGAGSHEAIRRAYIWADSLYTIVKHLKPHVEIVLGRPNSTTAQNYSGTHLSIQSQSVNPQNARDGDTGGETYTGDDDLYNDDEILRSATLAAHAAMGGGQTFPSPNLDSSHNNQESNRAPSPLAERLAPQTAPRGQAESTSTREQYERARLALSARATAKQQKGNNASQSHRRPWNDAEEDALMDGLDKVKGPHWSRILEMYGPGGRISEVLKERNQVQLKDKARNLKLFFLKSGQEVPPPLREVTGELKTRAPQATKQETTKDAVDNETPLENGGTTARDEMLEHAQGSATPEIVTPGPETENEVSQNGASEENDPDMAEAIQQAMKAVNATNALEAM